jgi:hypothetical protein
MGAYLITPTSVASPPSPEAPVPTTVAGTGPPPVVRGGGLPATGGSVDGLVFVGLLLVVFGLIAYFAAKAARRGWL